MMPEVYILLLNWNGWQDTIECLESVFRNDYPNYRVIVCDNDSSDGSLEKISQWAEGRLEQKPFVSSSLRSLSYPPIAKPITCVEYSRECAEQGGTTEDNDAAMVLVQNGANLGFAGGNNVGLRYALARGDFDYVWLLNNDTVIRPDALNMLVKRMTERPDAGMCGSTLPFYHEPDKIWALGGATYNKWLAKTACIGLFQPIGDPVDSALVEKSLAYLAGASMLVSRRFLEDVGLMCEEYFLFFEELDWAIRGRGHYGLAYAAESIVYHKVGASTDTATRINDGKSVSTRFMRKNQVLFTRKFFPCALPSVVVIVGIKSIKSFVYRHLMKRCNACIST